jgi:hypothetical protein
MIYHFGTAKKKKKKHATQFPANLPFTPTPTPQKIYFM